MEIQSLQSLKVRFTNILATLKVTSEELDTIISLKSKTTPKNAYKNSQFQSSKLI